MSAQPYEPGRLRRAAVLAVRHRGEQRYRVRGQDEPYYDVDLSADIPCYCKDAEFHGRGCKHELAARLASGDQALRLALGEMLLQIERRNRELERSMRRPQPSRPSMQRRRRAS
jgi:hypothetical protein